jgi:hypothetical protein
VVDLDTCASMYMEQLVIWTAMEEHFIPKCPGSPDTHRSGPYGSQHDLQRDMHMFNAYPKQNGWHEHGFAVAMEMDGTDGGESVIQSHDGVLELKAENLAVLQTKLCCCILRPLGALFKSVTSQQDPPAPLPMRRLHGFITECCEGGSLRNCLPQWMQPCSLSRRGRMFQLPFRARLDAARAGTHAEHTDTRRDWHFPIATADPSECILGRLLGEGAGCWYAPMQRVVFRPQPFNFHRSQLCAACATKISTCFPCADNIVLHTLCPPHNTF